MQVASHNHLPCISIAAAVSCLCNAPRPPDPRPAVQRGIKPLVIERTAVAAAASGKAGGFLARGWGDGSVTQQLHHQGFDLHARLAEELGISSYRRIPTLQVSAGRSRGGAKPPASWLDGDVARATMMDPGTAQVWTWAAVVTGCG